jgi:hypothetical protein
MEPAERADLVRELVATLDDFLFGALDPRFCVHQPAFRSSSLRMKPNDRLAST